MKNSPTTTPVAVSWLARTFVVLFAMGLFLVMQRIARVNPDLVAPYLAGWAAQTWTITLEHWAAAVLLPAGLWSATVLAMRELPATSRLKRYAALGGDPARYHLMGVSMAAIVAAVTFFGMADWELRGALLLVDDVARLDVLARCMPVATTALVRSCLMENSTAELAQFHVGAAGTLAFVLLAVGAHALDMRRAGR